MTPSPLPTLFLASVLLLLASGCTVGRPFSGPGFDPSRGVTAEGAGDAELAMGRAAHVQPPAVGGGGVDAGTARPRRLLRAPQTLRQGRLDAFGLDEQMAEISGLIQKEQRMERERLI